jgi:putative zinc finger/helix-turn-helix YgiT family protein
MMPEVQGVKPFPWKCGVCRQRLVVPAVVEYSTKVEHDGRTYTVSIPDLQVFRCENCGEVVLDDEAHRRISDLFRAQAGLLTPLHIRRHRERLGLTQKRLAGYLGIAEATLSRWETGAQVQQRGFDRLLRLYFGIARVRELMADEEQLASLEISETAAAAGSEDAERATRLTRLAAMLDGLPAQKEERALECLSGLLELMGEESSQAVG